MSTLSGFAVRTTETEAEASPSLLAASRGCIDALPPSLARPDRVASFLAANKLKLIVRGHECVMDGFQRFAGGKLVTVFSATNYCNRWQNAGAILLIGKDLEITPKVIFPFDDIEDAWLRTDARDEHLANQSPPTPPRK